MTLDKNLVVERMVNYFDKSSKGSYGRSEDLLADPTAIKFFNDMDSFKKELNKQSISI